MRCHAADGTSDLAALRATTIARPCRSEGDDDRSTMPRAGQPGTLLPTALWRGSSTSCSEPPPFGLLPGSLRSEMCETELQG